MMGPCKKDVAPLLTHWSYIFLALSHQYGLITHQQINPSLYGVHSSMYILMALQKTVATPLLMHWSYQSWAKPPICVAFSHKSNPRSKLCQGIQISWFQAKRWPTCPNSSTMTHTSKTPMSNQIITLEAVIFSPGKAHSRIIRSSSEKHKLIVLVLTQRPHLLVSGQGRKCVCKMLHSLSS